MKKIIVCTLCFFALAACGKKKATATDTTNTGIPGYDTTLPDEKIINRLKNTSWEMPSYKEASFHFKPEGVTVSHNKDFTMTDSRLSIISESNDIVLFTIDNLTNSVTYSLSIQDKDTVRIATHAAVPMELEQSHKDLAQEFKRIK